MSLALAEKDRSRLERQMEKVIAAVDQLDFYRNSELYAHMEFKEMSPEFAESMKKTLRKSFQNEAVYQSQSDFSDVKKKKSIRNHERVTETAPDREDSSGLALF